MLDLKYLLTEDPDDIWEGASNYVTFMIFGGRVIYSTEHGDNHPDMTHNLQFKIANGEFANDDEIKFYPPFDSPIDEEEWLIKLGDRFAEHGFHDFEEVMLNSKMRSMYDLVGRLTWHGAHYRSRYNICSCWNTLDQIRSQLPVLKMFFKQLKLNIRDYKFQPVESTDFYYDFFELASRSPARQQRSKEEIAKLMAKQHLDPNAKKQLGTLAGSDKLAQQASAAGFSSPIAFKQFTSQESVNMIKEDPDDFWSEVDNFVTFFVHNGRICYADGYIHPDMVENVIDVSHAIRYGGEVDQDPEIKFYPAFKTKSQKMAWSISLERHIMKVTGNDEVDTTIPPMDLRKAFQLSGRLTYPDSDYRGKYNLISFWDRATTVKSFMTLLKGWFKTLDLDITTYSFQPVDRTSYIPYNKFGGVPKFGTVRSKEEIAKLLAKQHLDPIAKQQLGTLKGSEKLAGQASAAGFNSPIAFKQFTNQESVNESLLTEEDPDDMYDTGVDNIIFGIHANRICWEKNGIHEEMGGEILDLSVMTAKQLDLKIYPPFENLKAKNKWIATWKDAIAIAPSARDAFQVSGRLSLNDKEDFGLMCTFWDPLKKIQKYLPLLEEMFRRSHLNIRKYDFAAIDIDQPLSYDQLYTWGVPSFKPIKRSKKEIADLMAKQHLDPTAKKQLGVLKGADKLAQQASAAGFNSPIAFKQFANQESVMVKEDPDDLYYGPAKPVVFWLINDHWVFARGVVSHGDLARAMWNILKFGNYRATHETYGGPPEQFKLEIFPAADEKWWEELKSVLSIEKDQETAMWAMIDSQETLRTMLPVAGRLGTAPRETLCAFWNDTERVRDYLPQIKALFDHLGLDVYNYKFDPIDVDWNDSENEMESLTWDDLRSDREIEPTRSAEDILALMRKQHVDPNAKKLLGKDLAGSTKYSQRALSAGFPDVARFKNYATTSESVDHNPDSIYFGTLSQNQVTFAIQSGHAIYVINEPDDEGFVHCSLQDILDFMFKYFTMTSKGKALQNSSRAWLKVFIDVATEAKELEARKVKWSKPNLLTWSEATQAKQMRFWPYITTCAELFKFMQTLPDDVWEPGNGRNAFEVSGRMTLNTINPTIAFWTRYSDIKTHVPIIFEMIQSLGQDPSQYKYDFVDQNKRISYQTLISSADLKPQKSKEEIEELMKKQHLDPSAKAAMGKALAGSMKSAWQSMKAGFPSVANFRQYATSSESVIKEDPDQIYLKYYQNPELAITFGILNNRLFFETTSEDQRVATHGQLLVTLAAAWNYLNTEGRPIKDSSDSYVQLFQKVYEWYEETDDENVIGKRASHVRFFKFFPHIESCAELYSYLGSITKVLTASIRDRDVYDLAGRMSLNPHEKVFSIWGHTDETLKYWPIIKLFFKGIGKDPQEFSFDISDQKHMLDFSELMAEAPPERSKEEVAELMKKQHIDPSAKAAMGKALAGSWKAVQRAVTAGYPTVANFKQFATQESFDGGMTDAGVYGAPSTPYADGDARVPTFLGLQRRPGFKSKKKKRKKKKVPYGALVKLEAVRTDLPPIEEDPMPGKLYYYHLTRHASIPSIRANGLVGSRNVISVAPHLTAVHWYADAIGDPTTLLRMKRKDVEADHVDDYYENTDTAELWLRTRIVSPDKLEVYENGVWRPLTATHESFKGFTEANDNLPTEDEIYAAGETQRGEPEGKMLEACRIIQKIGAPPILVMALEHIGDLAHRASRTNALINVKEKVDRFLPYFSYRSQRWDWWKEIEQGFEEGATYRVLEADPKLKAEWDLPHEDPKRRKNWQIWQEAQAKPERQVLIRKAKDLTYAEMKEYAEAHIKYNKPITTLGKLGKDAAIALGFCEYDKLKNILQQMDFWMEKYEKASPEERDIMFRS